MKKMLFVVVLTCFLPALSNAEHGIDLLAPAPELNHYVGMSFDEFVEAGRNVPDCNRAAQWIESLQSRIVGGASIQIGDSPVPNLKKMLLNAKHIYAENCSQ